MSQNGQAQFKNFTTSVAGFLKCLLLCQDIMRQSVNSVFGRTLFTSERYTGLSAFSAINQHSEKWNLTVQPPKYQQMQSSLRVILVEFFLLMSNRILYFFKNFHCLLKKYHLNYLSIFLYTLLYNSLTMISVCREVFRTYSNIYDEAFLRK